MSKNCIEERTTLCLVYEGPDIPSLDIKTGDAFNDILPKLGATISSTETVSPVNTVTTQSSCVSKFINTPFNYSITSSTSGKTFIWNLSDLTAKSVTVSGTKVSHSKLGSFNITSLPSTVKVTVIIDSECGDLTLSKSILISSKSEGDFTTVFEVQGGTDITEDTAIQDLLIEVSMLKSKLDTITSSNNEINIAKLSQQLSDLEQIDPLESVTYFDNQVQLTNNVGNVITELFTLIRNIQADVYTNKDSITGLRNSVNNLEL